jgi:hypothetical protein
VDPSRNAALKKLQRSALQRHGRASIRTDDYTQADPMLGMLDKMPTYAMLTKDAQRPMHNL